MLLKPQRSSMLGFRRSFKDSQNVVHIVAEYPLEIRTLVLVEFMARWSAVAVGLVFKVPYFCHSTAWPAKDKQVIDKFAQQIVWHNLQSFQTETFFAKWKQNHTCFCYCTMISPKLHTPLSAHVSSAKLLRSAFYCTCCTLFSSALCGTKREHLSLVRKVQNEIQE